MRRDGRVGRFAIVVAILLPSAAPAAPPAPDSLLRFPDTSADRLAFVARGQLWIAGRDGGPASALTDDPGQVFLPRFSPNGRTIAFTWRQGGTEDVWVVPTRGGAPRRLTHGPSNGPYDNMVAGWTPDGAAVVFLSQRGARFGRRDVAAWTVPRAGGLARRLPLENAGLLAFAPDGRAIAYDRTFRTFGGDRWKRYVGGQAPKIHILDRRTGGDRMLAPSPGTDTAPMWWRDRIYFLSDRGPERRLNLWVTDERGEAPRQVTHVADDDLDVPALGTDAITFGVDGRIWRVDLPAERLAPIDVNLPPARERPRSVRPAAFLRVEDGDGIADASLSPDGGTAVLSSYGQLLRTGGGRPDRVLTDGIADDEDKPAISPDGRLVAFVTFADGDPEVALRPLDGGPSRVLTREGDALFHTPIWSPDGKLLAVADAEHALWLVRTDGSGSVRIAIDPYADIRDAVFSPDNRRLAWSITRPTGLHALHLRDLATGREIVLSSSLDDDHAPAFTEDGRSMVFLSARREYPVLADRDQGPDIVTTESDGLFRVALPEAPAPASPASGLTDAATPLPTSPGVLTAPGVRGQTAFYEASMPGLVAGTVPGAPPALYALDLATGHDRVVAAGTDAVLSRDGRAALLLRGDAWVRVDTATGRATPIDLGADRIAIDHRAAWRKDVDEAWRFDRDLFWDRHLRGLDWPAIGRHYAALAAHAASHEDVVFLLGLMQGELSTSHMFVADGDTGDNRTPVETALPGADLEPDRATGLVRLARIFRGDPSRPRFRGPLGPGVDAHEGDLLRAIDGTVLASTDDPYRLLLGHRGPVRLTLQSGSSGPVRTVTVDAVTSEIAIRQLDWVRRNRERVAALSRGRVGYVFVGDFAETGTEDFARQFYAQTDRAGLVIDDRWNRGGFTSQWVVNVLGRRRAGLFVDRERGVTPLPGSLAPPALAVVTNIFSASDGDQFPFFMRRFGLAAVIGERTWGGVSGIAQPWTLIDGTTVTIPKDRLFAADGTPILENHGADPDIAVADDPGALPAGHDRQLECAVAVVLAGGRNGIETGRSHSPCASSTVPVAPQHERSENSR